MRYTLLLLSFLLTGFLHAQNFVSTTTQNKKLLLESFTAINSYYSAEGQAIAQQLYEDQAGEVVWLNWHAGPFAIPNTGQLDFRCSESVNVAELSGLTSYPAAMVNRQNFSAWAQTNNALAIDTDYWVAAADSILNQSSPVNVAAEASINISTGQLQVIVETYYTANASTNSNQLYVALLQDSVFASQEGAAQLHPSNYDSTTEEYLHRYIMREFLSDPNGKLINTTTSGSFQADTFYYSLPADFNAATLVEPYIQVAVWVAEDSTNVLNAAYASMQITGPNPIATSIVSSNWETDFDLLCGEEADFTLNVKNLGTDAIGSLRISYDVNGGASTGSYTANFSPAIPTGYTDQLTIPAVNNLNLGTNNVVFDIVEINSQPNPNSNSTLAMISKAPLYQSDSTNGVFQILFDDYPTDVSWELWDETWDSLILEGSNFVTANDTVTQDFEAQDGHCYSLKVTDAFGDGICCAYGQGFYQLSIKDLVIISGTNFGAVDGTKFVWQQGITAVDLIGEEDLDWELFPNPAQDFVNLELNSQSTEDLQLTVVNALGQTIAQEQLNLLVGKQYHRLNTADWANGMYIIHLQKNEKVSSKRLLITRP
jgi:hypothetical protein